jgi:hypothetical protein
MAPSTSPTPHLGPAKFNSALSKLKIVVLGYLVRGPIGGMAWHHLQYVLGLKSLGHDVLFLEDSDDYPSCYDPSAHAVTTDPTYGLTFATRVFNRLNLDREWTYYDAHKNAWHGPAANNAAAFIDQADLLINVSGVNPIRAGLENIPVRVLVDTDPAFTQVRHLTNESDRSRAKQHTAFFSFGESIEGGRSCIPSDGFNWKATRQPIVMDAWSSDSAPAGSAFTTVMQWDSYPAVEFNGQLFGMKSESFRVIADLPARVEVPLEIALGGHAAPRDELKRRGWRVVDPLVVARDPWDYQKYLAMSRGEFSVAKHGYITSQSGWFSERSACYLAMKRPVIAQDTGFSEHLPCGSGIWAFADADSAINALNQVQSNYLRECRVARELASEYFDARKVLTSLIERSFA